MECCLERILKERGEGPPGRYRSYRIDSAHVVSFNEVFPLSFSSWWSVLSLKKKKGAHYFIFCVLFQVHGRLHGPAMRIQRPGRILST